MEHRDYTVGLICALPIEYVVACELLDEDYPPLPSQSPYDSNAYTPGRIGEHNVVIASPPKEKYGLTSAATVAKDMLRSFSSIRFGLMVGIGGGAPSAKHDIRLGDVVVSSPVGRMGGVIYYEFGKAMQERKFQYIGSLNSPPPALLTALNKINMQHERQGHNIARSVSEMVARNPRLKRTYERPDAKDDRLYEATYVHADADKDCRTACSPSAPPVVARRDRTEADDDPVVHYGVIASADHLMKDATIRDALAAKEDVLCFEMEAAGLLENYPCLVIRGICDYSDTHKNDSWQGYAAATAAAYAKELLNNVLWEQARRTQTAAETTTKGLLGK
jgi:nucleoside phosphorylase